MGADWAARPHRGPRSQLCRPVGALNAFGRKGEPPTPPINIAGDYVGALYMALGLLAGVLNARQAARDRSSTRR